MRKEERHFMAVLRKHAGLNVKDAVPQWNKVNWRFCILSRDIRSCLYKSENFLYGVIRHPVLKAIINLFMHKFSAILSVNPAVEKIHLFRIFKRYNVITREYVRSHTLGQNLT